MNIGNLKYREDITLEEIYKLLDELNDSKYDNINKMDIYNKLIDEADNFGTGVLYKMYKDVDSYNLNDKNKKILKASIMFNIVIQDENNNSVVKFDKPYVYLKTADDLK